MKAKVSWVEGMKFVGDSESGHKVILDGANPGEGASPMEIILLVVGGCSFIDVVSILESAPVGDRMLCRCQWRTGR